MSSKWKGELTLCQRPTFAALATGTQPRTRRVERAQPGARLGQTPTHMCMYELLKRIVQTGARGQVVG